MDEAFGKLSVVKRAHAGNEAEHQRDRRIGYAFRKRRRRNNIARWQGSPWRNSALEPGCQTVLAENYAFDITLAALAKRLPARPAICGCRDCWMDRAVHASLRAVPINSSLICSNTLSLSRANLFEGAIARNTNC